MNVFRRKPSLGTPDTTIYASTYSAEVTKTYLKPRLSLEYKSDK